MNEITELITNYRDSAIKYNELKRAYKCRKAELYLEMADPDPAIREPGWKKPSDSIIDAKLEINPELMELKFRMESADLEAYLDKQALEMVVGGKHE